MILGIFVVTPPSTPPFAPTPAADAETGLPVSSKPDSRDSMALREGVHLRDDVLAEACALTQLKLKPVNTERGDGDNDDGDA